MNGERVTNDPLRARAEIQRLVHGDGV